jgi:hypothetical protein
MTITAIVVINLCDRLCQYQLDRQALDLGKSALDKAEVADVPQVTAVIMHVPAPEVSSEAEPPKGRSASWWPWRW